MDTSVEHEHKAEGYYGYPRTELIRFVPESARRLLDVGCAGGKFGAGVRARRPGIEVWGIEPVREIAAVAETRLDRVICSGVEAAIDALPDHHFDCISFNDVLEHLAEPWAVLKRMRPKLATGGCIVASIPNVRHFPVVQTLVFGADFRYGADGVMDSTHLRFFTRKSMERMFVDCGYTVTHLVGLKWEKFPLLLNIVNRLASRRFDDMHYVQFAVQAHLAGRES